MAASYRILDGKKIAADIKEEIAEKVKQRKSAGKRIPHLGIILVGDDGASTTYVDGKVRACKAVGFNYSLFRFAESITEERLGRQIEQINADEEIDGFIVQLPLPAHILVDRITDRIRPDKDVDGFTNQNFGSITSKHPLLMPATPFGVVELLRRYQVNLQGKHCVVVGASRLVGAPLSMMLAEHGKATVTICHKYTLDLASHTRMADILLVGVGKPGLIQADMVKEGAIVVDIGTTRVEDPSKPGGYTLKGDVQFDTVAPKCSLITPVPGGIGPMTIASLLLNTLTATERRD